MFELEEKLLAVTLYFENKFGRVGDNAGFPTLLEQIECIPYPKRHIGSARLYRLLLQLRCVCVSDESTAELLQTAHEYRTLHEHVACFPNDTYLTAMYHLCLQLSQPSIPTGGARHLPLQRFIVETCRAVLRMYMICFGREERLDRVEVILRDNLLSMQLEPADSSLCGLCLESPTKADIALSWCGRCGRTTYCSAGCQKVHWVVHKKICKQK